jgi:type III secretion protein V
VIELADDLLARARADGDRVARDGIAAMRERLHRELGISLPRVAVRGAPLPPGGFAVLVDDVPATTGRAPVDEAVALVAPDELVLAGIAASPAIDPLSGRCVSVIAAGDAARAASLGTVRAPVDRVLAEAAWALARTAHHLVGVQETQLLLDALEPVAPALVREATRQIPPALLAEVLRRLVEEGISVRPLRTILEALLESGGASRGAAALAEVCRRALRRHIGHRFGRGEPLVALLLDPAVEQSFRDASSGDGVAMDPRTAAKTLEALDAELQELPEPPVILTAPDVRRSVRSLVAPRFPRVAVLAYDELPAELAVRPVGRIAAAVTA